MNIPVLEGVLVRALAAQASAKQHTGLSQQFLLAGLIPTELQPTRLAPIILPKNPNALLNTLDLLLASHRAGNTRDRNEIISICNELRGQGIVDDSKYIHTHTYVCVLLYVCVCVLLYGLDGQLIAAQRKRIKKL